MSSIALNSSSPPPKSAFIDLTSYVDPTVLDSLDKIIQDILSHSSTTDCQTTPFTAENLRHASAVQFCDRDTSQWCASDVFVPRSGRDDFRQCRAHRGDDRTWRPNRNAYTFPGVLEVVKEKLPFFESTGKCCLIFNDPGDEGVEHADHNLDDLVSEFVWIRTKSSNKQFYVRDNETGEKCFAPREGPVVGWFDDHLVHNIETCVENKEPRGGCWSVRVDGRFKDSFRSVLVAQGVFGSQKVPQEGDGGRGLRGVLAMQQDGPVFLKRENEGVSDDEEEEDEEEEDDDKKEEVGEEEEEDDDEIEVGEEAKKLLQKLNDRGKDVPLNEVPNIAAGFAALRSVLKFPGDLDEKNA